MSALAEALVAAQAELPCALGKDPQAEPDTGEVKDAALAPHAAEVRTERDA